MVATEFRLILKGAWVVTNLLGMAAYLFIGSRRWKSPEELALPGNPADGLFLVLYLAPIAVPFLVLNIGALIALAFRAQATFRSNSIVVWVFMALLWFATVYYDVLHSAHLASANAATRLALNQAPNPSVNATANGAPPGPRGRSAYHRPRGPAATPLSARYLKR